MAPTIHSFTFRFETENRSLNYKLITKASERSHKHHSKVYFYNSDSCLYFIVIFNNVLFFFFLDREKETHEFYISWQCVYLYVTRDVPATKYILKTKEKNKQTFFLFSFLGQPTLC